MKKKINKYTKEELQYIMNVGYTIRDVALITGRSEDAIKAKRYALANPDKMKTKNREQKQRTRAIEAERLGGRKYDYWTKAEVELILKSKLTDDELSKQMGRTTSSIQKKRGRVLKELADAKKKRNKKTT
jgi:hypothetical protein